MRRIILGLLPLFIAACTSSEDRSPSENAYRLLSSPGRFFWYANDLAIGDSLRRALTNGVVTTLQEKGRYHFRIQGVYSAPRIHIFPLAISGSRMTVASSGETIDLRKTGDGLWEGDWVGSASADPRRCLLLSEGSSKAKVPTSAVLTAQGDYGTSVGLQIVLLSSAYKLKASQDSLVDSIRTVFQKIYGSAGITLSQVKILEGYAHPTYGAVWSQSNAFSLDRENWKLLYSLGGVEKSMPFDDVSSGVSAEDQPLVQIALVDSVYGSPTVIGLSPFYGQSVRQGASSTIELSGYYRTSGGLKRSDPGSIATTLAHEFGHFMGLRHSTVHLEQRFDSTIVEDGISDTPYSSICRLSAVLDTKMTGVGWQISPMAISETLCPDRTNLMFPFVDQSVAQEIVSEGQMRIAVANLGLLPR